MSAGVPAGTARVRYVAHSDAGARTGELNGRGDGDGRAVGRGSAQPRSTPPSFTLLQGHPSGLSPERQASWARLWPAWRALDEWEERVDGEFGDDLGEDMLVLWALLRFGGSRDLEGILAELVTDDLQPTFGNRLVEDIVQVAFALGAAWAASAGGADAPADAATPHVVH